MRIYVTGFMEKTSTERKIDHLNNKYLNLKNALETDRGHKDKKILAKLKSKLQKGSTRISKLS